MLAVLLLACNGRNGKVSDRSVLISESDVIESDSSIFDCILDSWEAVYLDDSSNDALLGNIMKVQYDDGLFFIESMSGNTQQHIFKVFDKEGQYKNDISRPGRARDEYVGNITWTLDPERNEVAIVVIGNPYTVKYFDYEGNFLRIVESNTLPETFADGRIAHMMSDGSILMESLFGMVPTNDLVAIHSDGSADSIVPMSSCKLSQESGFSTNFGNRYLDSQNGETWFMRALDNRLYKSSGSGQAECVASLAFLEEPSESDKLNYEMSWLWDSEHAHLDIFMNMKDMLLFTYGTRKAGVWHMYDKKSGAVHRYANTATNLVAMPQLKERGVYDNTIIGTYMPGLNGNDQELNSPELEAFYSRASESDNPTLVLYHFKK